MAPPPRVYFDCPKPVDIGVTRVLMILILCVLTFVVMFGCSFIVNLILHRWWPNLALYGLIAGGLIVRFQGVGAVWWWPLVVGIIGVGLASYTFRVLQVKGYGLFQLPKREAPSS